MLQPAGDLGFEQKPAPALRIAGACRIHAFQGHFTLKLRILRNEDFAESAAVSQLVLILIAFLALMHAYVTSDFSVANVAANSHSQKPLIYRISGVWGNHEGSMLLWVLILATFGAAVAVFGNNLPATLKANALAVQSSIALAFLRPGWVVTRHVVAVAQMLWSALLVHLTGGRIETHFHVFGSLGFLAGYRDWPVLLTATVVVAGEHFVRGLVWPESIYGIVNRLAAGLARQLTGRDVALGAS